MLSSFSLLPLTFLSLFPFTFLRIIYSSSFLRYFSGSFTSTEPPILLPTTSGNYYLLSSITTPLSSNSDYLVLKLNSTGQLQLSAKFSGPGSIIMKDAIIGSSDELFILGYTDSPAVAIFVSKLSS